MPEFQSLGEMTSAVNDKIAVGKDPEKPYVGLENIKSSSGVLNGYSASGSSISTNSVFERHDVLFGKLRPNLRKCVSAPFSGYCSTDILVLRANDGFYPGYVARSFQSEFVGRAAENSAIGTKMPRTSWRDLRELRVFAPSLPAQRLIARILDTLDTQIQKTEALIAKLEKVKEGLLHDLLTRGIDENGVLRPSPDQAPELYKDSPLGLIPISWGVEPLRDLSSNGMVNGVFKEVSRAGSGIPLVNVADLYKSNEVELDSCERFNANQVEIDKYDAALGDIFFTRSSLKLEGIAHCNWLKSSSRPAVFECHIIRIRPSKKIETRFLVAWCQSNYARLHFMGNAKQVTMTTISQDGIGSLKCPVPSINEQEAATNKIFSLEKRVADETLLLRKLSNQKQALMEDLLTGRVRVTPLLEQAQDTTPA